MIFHAFQREDDDSVFTVVRNISGATRAVGDAVAVSGGSLADGVRVSSPVSGELGLFRGIVAESILESAYGKAQVHGYCSYAKVLVADSSVAIAQGKPLVPVATKDYFVLANASIAVPGDGSGYVAALATVATGNTSVAVSSCKVFLRAL